MRQDPQKKKVESALNKMARSTHGYRVEDIFSPLGKQVVNVATTVPSRNHRWSYASGPPHADPQMRTEARHPLPL